MGLATVHSRAQNGLQANPVTVEVHLSPGLPGLSIVGLPEAAVRESRDRVRAAIINSGYQFPNRRVTINLAPADLHKEGGRFDLPIALGILAASSQIPAQALQDLEVLGELSLTGEIRTVRGVLPAAIRCSKVGHKLLIPGANKKKRPWRGTASLKVRFNLVQCAPFCTARAWQACRRANAAASPWSFPMCPRCAVNSRPSAHSLLMCGPPGAGKSMLAVRLPGILPPLEEEEAMEVAAVASISARGFDPQDWGRRPYRSPHHTASGVALVGGGGQPRPGEITLAHHGVLFLDELPEFERHVLEVLREPLESGQITVSRAARQVDFPARFHLLAAMNPCPCGYLGDSAGRCRCTPDQVSRYRGLVSGPLLDRIDLQVFVPRLEAGELLAERPPPAESSAEVRERVMQARARQLQRAGKTNAMLTPTELERDCVLDEAARQLLGTALTRLSLSARAYHRVLKVARTIADLAALPEVATAHVAEALRYRQW